MIRTASRRASLLLLALLSACTVQVQQSAPAPSCEPGSPDVMMLVTPSDVASVDPATAAEFGAGECVRVASNGPGHSFCCWKLEAQP